MTAPIIRTIERQSAHAHFAHLPQGYFCGRLTDRISSARARISGEEPAALQANYRYLVQLRYSVWRIKAPQRERGPRHDP